MIRLMDPYELALILNLNYLPLKAVWSEDFVCSDKRMFVRFSSGPHAMCCEPDPSNEILQMHTCNLCVQCALSSLNTMFIALTWTLHGPSALAEAVCLLMPFRLLGGAGE
jgi:hypothetical protein